jgi:RHS repeat-associated protein
LSGCAPLFINSAQYIAEVEYILDGTRTETFTYDANGNRETATVQYAGETNYEEKRDEYEYYPNTNRLANDGDFEYEYDADGNLTKKHNAFAEYRYTWNLRNQLSTVELRQLRRGWESEWESFLSTEDLNTLLVIFEAKYDEAGRRYWKRARQTDGSFTETSYAYTAAGLLYEKTKTSTGTKGRSYVYAGGKKLAQVEGTLDVATVDENRTVTGFPQEAIRYLVTDQVGSTRLMVDEAGAVTWYGEYRPFGETSWEESADGSATSQKYTSYTRDMEIGLDYAMARYYAPELGRFISEDPAEDGENWYAYVESNPLRFTDPTGLYIEYGMKGRTEYFTRDDPVQQKRLDIQYGFTSENGKTQSCKTAATINSYLADGVTRITKEQLDSVILEKGVIDAEIIAKDGSPNNANAISRETARALGREEYNQLGEKTGKIDGTTPAVVTMLSEELGTSHVVYKDAQGMIDSLDPNRPEAKTYSDSEQQTITKTVLPEVQKARDDAEKAAAAREAAQLAELERARETSPQQPSSVGGSESGTKVICEELYRQGLMDEDIHAADEAFGAWMERHMPLVLHGYQAWAKPVVRRMRSSKEFTDLVNFFVEPWTKEMAHLMGAREKGSFLGAVVMIIGIPLCGLIGFVLTPIGLLSVTILAILTSFKRKCRMKALLSAKERI